MSFRRPSLASVKDPAQLLDILCGLYDRASKPSGGNLTNFVVTTIHDASTSSFITLAPGGVVFANGLGILASDPAKFAYNDTTGKVTIAGLAPGGIVKASAAGILQLAAVGADYADPLAPYWASSNSHLPTNGVNLGALSSGILYQTVAAGVSTPAAFNPTAGYLLFGGGGSNPAQDSNLFWDNTNKRLGIGTATPGFVLDVLGNTNAAIGFRLTNSSSGTSSQIQNQVQNDAGSLGYFGISSSTYAAFSFAPLAGGQAFFGGFQVPVSIFTQSAKPIIFYANATEVGRWLSGGGLQVVNLSAGGLVKASVGAGLLSIATGGTDYMVGPLTGDVTTPSAGSAITTIASHAVTSAKFRQGAANTLVGNATAGTADVTDIPLNAPLFFSGGNLILNIDGTSLLLSGGTTLLRAALTGDVTAGTGSNATTIASHAVSYAKMQQAGAATLLGNPTGSTANVQEITLGTGLSFAGSVLNATASGGTVTGVSATAPLFITGGASPTPNVTIQGAVTTGGTSTSATSLGALASGVLQQTVTAGVSAPSVFVSTVARIPFGAGSGLLTDSTLLTWDGTKLAVGTASPSANSVAHFYRSNNGQADLVIANDNAGASAQCAVRLTRDTPGTTTDSLLFALLGTNFSAGASPFLQAKSALFELEDTGNFAFSVLNTTGDFVWGTGASRTLQMTLKNAGQLQLTSLAAGGLVKAAVTTGQLGLGAVGVDYQAPMTAGPGINFTVSGTKVNLGSVGAPTAPTIAEFAGIPPTAASAAGMQAVYLWDLVNISLTGTTHVTGNGLALASFAGPSITDASAVTVDTASTLLVTGPPTAAGSVTLTKPYSLWVAAGATQLDGAVGINGVTVPTNASLVTGITTTTNRDRVQFFVGGGALGATGTGDNTLFDVNPAATTIRAGVTAGIYATQRIRQITYSGTATITEAASLYIDGAPITGGGISGTGWALHVGAAGAVGSARFDGGIRATLLAAGGVTATNTSGDLGIAGVGGLPPAISAEQHYYINVTGSTLVTGGNVWLATSQNSGAGATAVEYSHSFAASSASLSLRITTNAITAGTLTIAISRNGASFSTLSLTSASSGSINTGTLAVSSPAIGDRWGVLVTATGTTMSGAMVFTATLTLSPNVF